MTNVMAGKELNTQLYISGRARDLNCGLSLHLLLYFVYVNRVGSDDMGG